MIDLQEYGWVPEPLWEGELPARVTAVHKERYALICEQGECYGRLKAGVYFGREAEKFPTVGDFVTIAWNPGGDSVILRTLPRRTFFSRRDPTPGHPAEQAVAANFDTVFIVQSFNSNFNTGRLERYLTQAWQSGAQPVVVLTKADLPGDHAAMLAAAERAAPGVTVFAVSARTGEGLEKLSLCLLPGKTLVLLGSSGVGKSSLINRLAGRELMAVGEIREADGRGRHTTTHRQLFKLPSGALVIDTPGMRQLGMWDAAEGLGEAFPDVERFLGLCKFSDCRHETEPGCAIRQAIDEGLLSPERWESYRKLHGEALLTAGIDDLRRRKQQRNKRLAKEQRQRRKAGL